MCVIDRHDMTLAVKVALNPNSINQSRYGSLPYSVKNVVYTGSDKRELNALYRSCHPIILDP